MSERPKGEKQESLWRRGLAVEWGAEILGILLPEPFHRVWGERAKAGKMR